MKKYIVHQTVTAETFDTICHRYAICGWKEIDVIGTLNHPQEIVFEWIGDGLPEYPNLSHL
ncbi:MAG: hypothetical protein E7293_03185 [Lachnospiraceae bacterium]|nr:hypothetical protein [Lachnospiraceae bacterium]